MSGKRLKPTMNSTKSPFRYEFGEKIGAGQDNFVREFKGNKAAELVVKISKQKGTSFESHERAMKSTLYKKNKYEILKRFLGDFIPESHFVVGSKSEGQREPVVVPKSYTIQQRVPQFQIGDLTPEQQRDPRLLRQLYVLMRKLQNMYSVISEVNTITGNDSLDGKLDLGDVSKYVREQDQPNSFNPGQAIEKLKNSPNLLINPETMGIYCIDFDDGAWDEEKSSAKAVLEYIADSDPNVQSIIALDPNVIPLPPITNGSEKSVA